MNKLIASKFWWIYLLILLFGINYISSFIHFRLDLTQEKRYTLSKPTKRILQGLNDQVSVTVFLNGEMPAGFKKLRQTTAEMLQEFREIAKANLQFKFVKPGDGTDSSSLSMDSLLRLGLKPTNVRVQAKEGEGEEQRYLFPGALIEYKDRVIPVDFFEGTKTASGDYTTALNSLNSAEALLEYKLINGIQRISTDSVPVVGYLLGNGETFTANVKDLVDNTLRSNYGFSFVPIDSVPLIPPAFNALVIVKPTKPFTERQKLKLDQFVMHGGKIIWLVDRLYAELDSLMRSQSDFVAYDRGLNLDDLLFKYGVRINPDLLQDKQSDELPMVVGNVGNQPQMQLVPFPYFPLLTPNPNHPITSNLDQILSIFPNSIDTVEAAGIKKTILLYSSATARRLSTPAIVSLNSVKTEDDLKTFTQKHVPVAILLEGKFNSLFNNRISTATRDSLNNFYQQPFLAQSTLDNKMLVVSDADIVSNVVTQNEGPLYMGYNQFTKQRFANRDFVLNSLEYMLNPTGILETRSKDFTLRLLDYKKVEEEKFKWQLINIGAPILLIILFGFVYQSLRKRKYQRA